MTLGYVHVSAEDNAEAVRWLPALLTTLEPADLRFAEVQELHVAIQ